jgi:uncharacterized protein (DUF305 family)
VPLVLAAALLFAAAPVTAQRPTDADVRFVRDMIPHHQQALDMTALVAARTESRALRLLAERIETAQRDEIAWMRAWLADHDAEAPDAHAGHDMHGGHGSAHDTHGAAHGSAPVAHDMDHALMPGMLTPNEMNRLAAASGSIFEGLFLEGMIRHHEGALGMVRDLYASPGAAQTPDLFRFASDVEADQAAEIGRMRAMLAALFFSRP